MRTLASVLGFALLGTAGVTPARSISPQAPPRCDAPEYRQLDFWVGNWQVTIGGQPVGTNLVTLEEDSCLVHEHWKGARGGTGQSFNFYDRTDGHWHQVWVSNHGAVLTLSGTYHDGRLEYTGVQKAAADAPAVPQRLTFTRNADGTVRQLWETSTDGTTWQTAFDGLYTRRTP
jgi:hypothetical protein